MSSSMPSGRRETVHAPGTIFSTALQDGRFLLQRARTSGRHFFFPRIAEPGSGAFEFDWVEASGEGHVHATTVVRPRPPALAYNIALIDLCEGPRVMSRVEHVAPDAVRIGMAVRAFIGRDGDGAILLFRPAESS